ncbi:hypothetical protein QQF64_010978 [Cirrhinus molitorella]|uniref:Uncharacterized protein n=2 Tax=Cirrhinus molitorella TaxID=172907 RepID=A0ABR3LXW7_9TELE|nr:hypothetical protein Q8A67_019687 [Cirrhinus molitorella]
MLRLFVLFTAMLLCNVGVSDSTTDYPEGGDETVGDQFDTTTATTEPPIHFDSWEVLYGEAGHNNQHDYEDTSDDHNTAPAK